MKRRTNKDFLDVLDVVGSCQETPNNRSVKCTLHYLQGLQTLTKLKFIYLRV